MDVTSRATPVKGLGEFVTLDGAAQALGLTYWAVRGLIKRGNIPTVRLGRSTLVRLSDLATVVQSTVRE